MLGKPFPGWENFERELAVQFALLLRILYALPREEPRRRLLTLFLESLPLETDRGRPKKSKEKLQSISHGGYMWELWKNELKQAWHMKTSLERVSQNPRGRLQKQFLEDVVKAVLSPKATPESSVAKVYAWRNNLGEGTTRNALRDYLKFTGWTLKLDS